MLNKTVYKNLDLLRTEVREAFKVPGVIKKSIRLFRMGLSEPYYVDFDVLINDPYICEQIVRLYAIKIMEISRERPIELLGFIEKYSGGTIGAIRIAGAISIYTRIPNVPIRLTKEIGFERVKIPPIIGKPRKGRLSGIKVAIITDHSTTGGEVLNAIDAVEYNGGNVTDVIAFSVRTDAIKLEDFNKKGVVFHSLYKLPEDLQKIELDLSE